MNAEEKIAKSPSETEGFNEIISSLKMKIDELELQLAVERSKNEIDILSMLEIFWGPNK
jgi:hypothetical protein